MEESLVPVVLGPVEVQLVAVVTVAKQTPNIQIDSLRIAHNSLQKIKKPIPLA